MLAGCVKRFEHYRVRHHRALEEHGERGRPLLIHLYLGLGLIDRLTDFPSYFSFLNGACAWCLLPVRHFLPCLPSTTLHQHYGKASHSLERYTWLVPMVHMMWCLTYYDSCHTMLYMAKTKLDLRLS